MINSLDCAMVLYPCIKRPVYLNKNTIFVDAFSAIAMRHEERIPEALFQEDGHYLGRPADFEDRIVARRLRLLQAVPHFTGKNYQLLDIGCGNGASMFGLHQQMKSCVGLEITDEHLSEFERYKQSHGIENCSFELLDIEKTDKRFEADRIISFEVIEHLSSEDGLRFYYESLKPGGLMAVSVPNKWWIFETHGASLPLLPWNRVPFFSWLPRPIHERFAHARIYTKGRITRLLQKHGFEVLSATYVTAPMDVLPAGKFKEWVIRWFFNSDSTRVPFKATSVFVVARKPL